MEFKTKKELESYIAKKGHIVFETCYWLKMADGKYELFEKYEMGDDIEPIDEDIYHTDFRCSDEEPIQDVSYIGDKLFAISKRLY